VVAVAGSLVEIALAEAVFPAVVVSAAVVPAEVVPVEVAVADSSAEIVLAEAFLAVVAVHFAVPIVPLVAQDFAQDFASRDVAHPAAFVRCVLPTVLASRLGFHLTEFLLRTVHSVVPATVALAPALAGHRRPTAPTLVNPEAPKTFPKLIFPLIYASSPPTILQSTHN
jgi:hypothetical protein